MGRILGPWGVKGWVKVAPFSESVGALCEYRRWFVGKGSEWREVAVEEAALHGSTVLARFAGCGDRDQAFAYRGSDIAIPRDELPAAGDEEIYWADLIGLAVVNLQGEPLGRITGMFSNGAHDVMRIGEGAAERLVPFVEPALQAVDRATGIVTVDWGLDW